MRDLSRPKVEGFLPHTQHVNLRMVKNPDCSEEGSYVRLIDFVYHSTLGWRVIRKKKRAAG